MSIVIVSKEGLFADTLLLYLQSHFRDKEISFVQNGHQLSKILHDHGNTSDLVLFDDFDGYQSQNLIVEFRNRFPDVPIALMVDHLGKDTVFYALKQKARGVILKNSSGYTLIHGVKEMLEGKSFYCPALQDIQSGLFTGKICDGLSCSDACTLINRDGQKITSHKSTKTLSSEG